MAPGPDENTGLLENGGSRASYHPSSSRQDVAPEYVLPITLLVALAMASTAATAFFAYAKLLCEDPRHCESEQISKYAGSVAIATCIANFLAMSMLGYLQKLANADRKLALLLWMVLIGLSVGDISGALSSRVFEGLASDNLLHFTLNAIYSQSQSGKLTSSLISSSLALYMTGISVSPFVAGLFKNFTISFFIALALFALSVAYLQLLVTHYPIKAKHNPAVALESKRHAAENRAVHDLSALCKRWISTVLSPLRLLPRQPGYILVSLCLLAYNVIQSYIFNALLVHTSSRFGFTGKQNGLILSMMHAVAALYIFASIHLFPRVTQCFRENELFQILRTRGITRERDAILALISLFIQSLALTALGLASEARQLYFGTVILALGLPAPSYVKAYFSSTTTIAGRCLTARLK